MDIKRSILFVALAIVSYALVLQWNKDYGQPELPAQTATFNQTEGLPDTSVPAGNAANADVPTTQNAQASLPNEQKPAATSDQLIRVKTDVLDLTIDPRGGDVIKLGLTQYPLRQDRPDVPFPLFERDNQRTYLAQSGLTGANGPDAAASGRPLYASAKPGYELADGQDQMVVDLTYAQDGVSYIKRFTFHRGLKNDCTEKEKAEEARVHQPQCLSGRRDLPDRQPERQTVERLAVRPAQA